MKISRGTLIFGGVIVAIIVLVAGGVWVASLLSGGGQGNTAQKTNFFSSLFPFGTNSPTTGTKSGNGSQNNAPSGPAPSLREVSHAPIGGAHFETDGTVRYIERETGHVFETRPESFGVTRISNSTVPGIQNTAWLGDSAFIIQYLDENKAIRNYFASLATSTPDQTLVGRFILNATDVLPSYDEKHMLLGNRTSSGISVILSDTDEKNRSALFASPLRSWSIIPSGKDVFLESAPSTEGGYLYRVRQGQSLEKLIGNVPGLMALPSSSGAFIAFSSVRNGTVSLSTYNALQGTIVDAPIPTLAEKCAWMPGQAPLLFCGVPSSVSGVSLENWFMGVQSFSDSAWIIDPLHGTAKIVRDLEKETGEPIDIINPSVSPNGSYAIFTNKNDLSLWSLALTQQ